MVARTRSLPDCRPLLADPDDLTVVFRPVVDLARSLVAGYQAGARFPGTADPGVWIAAAADAGLAAEVEALFVHKALTRLPWVPGGCFLLLPLQAGLLGSPAVQGALTSRPRLDGLVVELDGPSPAAAVLRARGARIALAGAPAGVPDLAVVDRATVAACADTGSVLGAVPGAPPVIADDVETAQDLAAALRSGAALARGWLFGPPSVSFDALSPSAAELVRTHGARTRLVDPVLALLRPVHRVAAPASGTAPAVEVDADGRALALVIAGPGGLTWRRPVSLCVLPDAPAGETLRLALSRAPEHRHDPVLCADEDGRPLGIVHVAELSRAVR